MSKKVLSMLFVALVLVLGVVSPVAAQEPVTITWFIGLGSGTNEQQLAAENQFVTDFNASHPDINLVLNIAPTFEVAVDTLRTLIAAGTPPDIVGPVGVGGSNSFADQFLDLKDLIEQSNYDLSGFDANLLKLYETTNGGFSAIPFGVFPAMIYYNRGLFDEAGLNYPPQAFDEMYTMPDGTEVEWNYDTLAQIAQMLTVDANGNDATSADFDADNIVQFGFETGFERLRLVWTEIQPETFYDWDTQTANMPDSWRTATQWLWDGYWTSHFIANQSYRSSDSFNDGDATNPNPFDTGKIGMVISPLWYSCCIGNSVGNFEWDLAVVPKSLDGEYHVAMDADTFRIIKGTAHPDEAFTVLSYLLDEGVPALAPVYGAFPARPEYQQPYIDTQSARYDWGVNWQLAADSLAYAIPSSQHHESNLPNWQQVYDREFALLTLLRGDGGATIDVNAELDTFQADVQAITEEASS
jgi:multiple sugar transport system substrate-binding protein